MYVRRVQNLRLHGKLAQDFAYTPDTASPLSPELPVLIFCALSLLRRLSPPPFARARPSVRRRRAIFPFPLLAAQSLASSARSVEDFARSLAQSGKSATKQHSGTRGHAQPTTHALLPPFCFARPPGRVRWPQLYPGRGRPNGTRLSLSLSLCDCSLDFKGLAIGSNIFYIQTLYRFSCAGILLSLCAVGGDIVPKVTKSQNH